MSIFLAALLGLVQGLCEFLPVSSSGHLVLLQTLFGIEEGALFFDTMLHVGTLIAVFVVFRKQIWDIIRHPFQKKTAMLLIATVMTVLVYIPLQDFFESAFGGGYLFVGFLLTTLVILISERLASGKKKIESMKFYDAVAIGLMQGIAILPGLSRSGSTIAGCRICGLKKSDAADFSFLLSIPVILGSLLVQIPDVIEAGIGDVSWGAVLVGMLVAAVSGYFAVKFMIALIKKRRLTGFAIYTAMLGILIAADKFIFHLFF